MAVDRSLADVFQDIVGNVQEIVRAEVSLVKAEAREEVSKALASFAWLIAGSISALFAPDSSSAESSGSRACIQPPNAPSRR